MKIFLTGRPGSGKSSVVKLVVKKLTTNDVRVGGILTPEVRVAGKRTGFKVVDIVSNEEATLASIEKPKEGRCIKFGKYWVWVEEFERVSLRALEVALKSCEVIVIDEIGKMELLSKKFEKLVESVVKSDKPLVAVVHRKLVDKYGSFGKTIWVEKGNVDEVAGGIVERILKSLGE